MKKFLLIAFLFASVYSMACSCAYHYSFCETRTQIQNDVVIYGKVIDTAAFKIRIERFNTLEGIENRDTITVWNDTNIWCTGTVSMKASGIANPGDSILLILPRIDSIVNAWDVVGDYRRPPYLCVTPSLLISNDTLRGVVFQEYKASIPPSFKTYTNLQIDEYLSLIQSNPSNCLSISDTTFSYIPFPENNVKWKESGFNVHQSPSCNEQEYTYVGDTTYSGKTYHILSFDSIAGSYYGTSCIGPYVTGSKLVYYRNDLANKKVFFISEALSTSPQERLVYDFDLELGDTLPYSLIATGLSTGNRYTVDSIDYVNIAGRFRKRFLVYVATFNGYQSLIEGIGSSAGLLEDLNNLSGLCCGTYLDCYSLDGISYQQGQHGGTCSLINSVGENSIRNLQLYPNPTNGIVNIETEEEIRSIRVFDLQGKLIQSFVKQRLVTLSGVEVGFEVKTKQISLPEKSGLYLIKIETEKGAVLNRKIIRN